MPRYRVDLFDSFSEQPFGGSPAGIIYGAADLAASDMQKIAKEIGAPATCFVMNAGKQGHLICKKLLRKSGLRPPVLL